MTCLIVYVDGVGLLGPGLPDWPSGRAVLDGSAPFVPRPVQLPSPASLPPAERRRVGRVVKVALAVGAEAAAGHDVRNLPTVFAASGADGDTCHEICQMLASSDRQISPTRFHNSVHNAPAGYWSIAAASMAPSTSLGAFNGSFCAGLLEAACQVCVGRTPVLLIAYDTGYPEPLHHARPIDDAFGVALLLAPIATDTSLGRLAIELTDATPDAIATPALEALRVAYPAARSLPLLAALARRAPEKLALEYLDHHRLEVTWTPCS